ncbi:threonine-phosphate decarboxylase CobD [Thiohalophilus thiocyanatoxydans]|uniref:threonine-phosphate decarboxylase n=1 Tax=Thiohalophilus thiocyanatoxydans TaxID=381308 RepID=A0A4R8IF40_9GAMM|nr:threonine-phosphate decarboxylase CobD [Thiohalophilus thiocyanatoxydans]TDX97896.1 L-threonine O-3-phosphate decarboxylase [Thiohalophilus thiocyanatoxydans]
MPQHGGNLLEAARRYGRAPEQWLDLSTGINPGAYPVPALPPRVWQQLPQQSDGLIDAALEYYGAPVALPVAGSQQAIQLLPGLRAPGRVGVLAPSYNEHGYRWEQAGHTRVALHPDTIESRLDTQIDTLDVLVVVNPNNPTGHRFAPAQLLEWHRRLQARGGWLVVDEAFIDCTPEQSLAAYSHLPGLIVLRSIGKFFGLPGLRGGFVLAEVGLLAALDERLGPWAVAGPARFIMQTALQDRNWQQRMREQLPRASERLAQLLTEYGLPVGDRSPLFVWLPTSDAYTLHEQLAHQGIWSRYFDPAAGGPGLRLGLPGAESEWQRLESALAQLPQSKPNQVVHA